MFGGWTDQEENNFWMSYTDLVTGFMIIFMIISLSLSLLSEEERTIASKYTELINEFEAAFQQQAAVEVADSATIRFTIQDRQLFQSNNHKPTRNFTDILDEFIPIYYGKIEELYRERQDSFLIKEIRIEGHTDTVGDYINNLITSSARSLEIQKYIVRSEYFDTLDVAFKEFVRSNSIACGYAYTRPLDNEGKSIRSEDQIYDPDKSRRVEFRVLFEYKEQ